MIRQVSFKHGWFYHYRVHNQKMNLIENRFQTLHTYLNAMFQHCPHHYFEAGPRGSSLKFPMKGLDMLELHGHEVSDLTELGLEVNSDRYKTNHSRVQVFMLEQDDKTLAVEVPIWIMPDELPGFRHIFDSNEPLTGHIDVLRLEDGKIWVWDYKPGAMKEKYAATQVYFYATMLSKRTGIPIEHFRCGYFDEHKAYVFQPEKQLLYNLLN